MKKLLALVAAITLFSTLYARAEDAKYLGAFDLKYTEQVWSPNMNDVPVGDITHDSVVADYRLPNTAGTKFSIRPANTYAFGCPIESVAQAYFLVEKNEAGEEIGQTDITEADAVTREGGIYVVRVVIANLKACQGYGTSFLALLRK